MASEIGRKRLNPEVADVFEVCDGQLWLRAGKAVQWLEASRDSERNVIVRIRKHPHHSHHYAYLSQPGRLIPILKKFVGR